MAFPYTLGHLYVNENEDFYVNESGDNYISGTTGVVKIIDLDSNYEQSFSLESKINTTMSLESEIHIEG